MKIILGAVVFLLSMPVAAQTVRYDDGSYYNDDYIHPEGSMKTAPIVESKLLIPPPAVIKPMKRIAPIKARKPSGGFHEVHSGGRAGDFREVGNDQDPIDSRSSK